jgi:hypothetical protein
MTAVDTILGYLRNGGATRRESVAALARLITAENVAAIMAALPEDVVTDVERWACTVPVKGGVVVGANLSSAEAQRIAENHELAVRAVREWAARRGSRANPNARGKVDLLHGTDRTATPNVNLP